MYVRLQQGGRERLLCFHVMVWIYLFLTVNLGLLCGVNPMGSFLVSPGPSVPPSVPSYLPYCLVLWCGKRLFCVWYVDLGHPGLNPCLNALCSPSKVCITHFPCFPTWKAEPCNDTCLPCEMVVYQLPADKLRAPWERAEYY